MSTYKFCLHDDAETLIAEELKPCSNDLAALTYARVLLAKASSIMIWRGDTFIDRVARAKTGGVLRAYRVEFLAAAEAVAHAYEVKADGVREALAMARIEFARLGTVYKAHAYRVFDPRALIYYAQK